MKRTCGLWVLIWAAVGLVGCLCGGPVESVLVIYDGDGGTEIQQFCATDLAECSDFAAQTCDVQRDCPTEAPFVCVACCSDAGRPIGRCVPVDY